MHPFFNGLKPTLHISHRGGAGISPENTMFAFHRAVEEFRTDMLELDVHLTRDRELVVSHDSKVDRCTDGKGAIAAMNLADLQRLDAAFHFSTDGGRTFPLRGHGIRIPTLREVLGTFKAMRVNIELKSESAGGESALAELLRAEKAVPRVCIGSTSDAVAERLYAALPEACHFYPRNALMAFVLRVKLGAEPAQDPRYSVIDAPLKMMGMCVVDPHLLEVAHRHEKWVNVWTVDDPEDMRRLILEGAGGIMSDRPDLLRQALDRYQTHA